MTFERHANFILSDSNLLLKIIGIQTYIELTLDNEAMATEWFESVKYIFELYSGITIGESKNVFLNTLERFPFINNLTSNSQRIKLPGMLGIIHDNYRYNSGNKDLWMSINDEIQEGIQLNLLSEGELDHEEN